MHVRGRIDAEDGTGEGETARSGERTHLFLEATLVFGGASERVRVRNLSPTGALIEAPIAPSIGATVILHRGPLAVTGRTMWVSAGRCGIEFDAPLAVADWMPAKLASRHAPTASAARGPIAPVALPFDPAPMALDRKEATADNVSDHPALPAESGTANTVRAIEELVSLQADMRAALQELKRPGVDNHAELEALAAALARIWGIAMTLRNV